MGYCFTQRRFAEGATPAKFAILLLLIVGADVTASTLAAILLLLVVGADVPASTLDAILLPLVVGAD